MKGCRTIHHLTLAAVVRCLVLGIVAVGVFAALGVSPAVAKAGTGPPANPASCPKSNAIKNFSTATNVAATSADNTLTKTTTYTFISLTSENPSGGVPGLIE